MTLEQLYGFLQSIIKSLESNPEFERKLFLAGTMIAALTEVINDEQTNTLVEQFLEIKCP